MSVLAEAQPKPSRPRAARVGPRPHLGRALLAVAAWLGLAGYAAGLVVYIAYPGFVDHVEPAVASIASRLFSGIQIYPADASTPPFGLQYGPLTYPIAGLFIFLFQNAVFGAKFASALAAATGVAVLGRFFFRSGEARLALISVGVVAWWLLFFRHWSFWSRPDPYLLLTVCLAIASTAIASPRKNAIALGLLIGCAMGLKIHAALAFLPLIGLLWHRQGWRGLFLAGPVAVVVLLVPFAFPSISLTGYLEGLRLAGRHGISWDVFKAVFPCSLLLAAPALLALRAAFVTNHAEARAELRTHWAFWAALPLGLCLALVIASKRGAGLGHLVPFIPLLGYALFRLAALIRSAPQNSKRWFAVSPYRWVAIYAPVLVVAAVTVQMPMLAHYRNNWTVQNTVRSDLESILESTSPFRIAIGPGSHGYASTYARAELIRRGHPYVLEPAALMDLQVAAVPLDIETILDPPDVDIWLIPRNTHPFGIQNFYDTGFVLPLDLQVKFQQRWERQGQTKAFDLWVRRSDAP